MRWAWIVVRVVLAIACTSACTSDVELGSRCTYASDCRSPLACVLGRCRSECIEHRDCPLDALCLRDLAGNGACALPDERACGGSDARCAVGLLCVENECVNACETVAQCPSGSRCEPASDGRARCVRDDRPTDAGAPPDANDGGATDGDAGRIDAGLDGGTAGCTGTGCVVEIAAGSGFTCARTGDGAVWCWGARTGDGTPRAPCGTGAPCSPVPVRVRVEGGPLVGAITIAAGSSSACAIVTGGRVVCWGSNDSGQLGAPHDGTIAQPVRAVGGAGELDRVIALAPANEAWLAQRDVMPALVGWGLAEDQLFLEPTTTRTTPIAIDAGPFAQVSAGGWHACVRDATSTRCWGRNGEGQAGGATTGTGEVVSMLTRIAALTTSSLVSNARGTCALDGDDVRCWGSGFVLGGRGADLAPCYCSSAPLAIPRGAGVAYRAVFSSPASNTMFALDGRGQAWCWGYNDVGWICGGEGQYDVGAPVARAVPADTVAIAVGFEHACALAQGAVWCWGRNDEGAVGDGTLIGPVRDPVRVDIDR